MREESFDILIVGAGPAGIAAAVAAAEAGRRVGLIDDNPDVGGQIWRSERRSASSAVAREWFEKFERANVRVISGASVIAQPQPGALLADASDCADFIHSGDFAAFNARASFAPAAPVDSTGVNDRPAPLTPADAALVAPPLLLLRYRKLILATGARERFLPFPGWTLPNVTGVGGLAALVKAGLPIAGKRVVVAGSGPLLLAVASALKSHGARVRIVAEQAPWRRVAGFVTELLSSPGKLKQAMGLRWSLRGVAYRPGWWPVTAQGDGQLRSVTLTNGRRLRTIDCDYLACGFGLVPNIDLPLLIGCAVRDGLVHVDASQQTSVRNVYACGEVTGVGGLELALPEGLIAGYAASGNPARAAEHYLERFGAWQFARAMDDAFALRDALKTIAEPDTIVCRCEDVPLSSLRPFGSWVDAKLQTRCGMGACQGRVCGGATEFLFGWQRVSVRPPIYPTSVAALMAASELQEHAATK